MNWYLEVLRKYAVFQGRARRKEYWMFVLFNVVITLVLLLIGNLMGMHRYSSGQNTLTLLYGLAVLLPSLAVQVRRLHDTGRTGWWILIVFVPIIGGIVLLVFDLLDSVPANEYGPNPKQIQA